MSGDGDGVYAWLQANGWEWASGPTERNVTDAIEVRDAEIKRLRAENADLQEGQLTNRWPLHKMLAAERALADQLAEALAWWGKGNDAGDTAIAAWEEARRE